MNALIKKEIRLLLPNFSLAAVLALGYWLVSTDDQLENGLSIILRTLPLFLCPAVVLMMALDSFGREISNHTFANLLAQPVSRERVWWTKVLLLAVALLIVYGVWWLSYLLHLPKHFRSDPGCLSQVFASTTLLLVTAYSGGLWTVLLLRQVGAAFWIAALIPCALAGLTAYLTEKCSHGDSDEFNIVIVLGIYSLAGFFWARRLFLRAQDFQWSGGQITLPGWFRLSGRFVPATGVAGRRPKLALISKELQLHQSTLIIAVVLAGLHLIPVLIRKNYAGWKDAAFLEFFVEAFWVLWFLMPILVGCTAVAEERKLGMLESQLCLPVRRRTQFVVKLGVALLLSIVFAVVMPLLIEGGRIVPAAMDFSGGNDEISFLAQFPTGRTLLTAWQLILRFLPYVPFVLCGVAFLLIAFYASTLTRNMLQAFGLAILGISLAWAMLAGASFAVPAFGVTLWHGSLIYVIGVPVLTLTLAALAVGNFKRVFVGWPVWRRNLLVFLTALVGVMGLTSLIYHRAWEVFMRLEPPHGQARLTRANLQLVGCSYTDFAVRLPDGRIWIGRFVPGVNNFADALLGNWQMNEAFPGGRSLEGTNWVSVAFFNGDIAAVKSDGSLWTRVKPENPKRVWKRSAATASGPIELVRYGSASDWKCVADRFAVKNDGTLWQLGMDADRRRTNWPGLHAFQPQRLGTNTDWVNLTSQARHGIVFHKTDGSAWCNVGPVVRLKETEPLALKLDEQTTLYRSVTDDAGTWRGQTEIWTHRWYCEFGIRQDGTLRICGIWKLPRGKTSGPLELVEANLQLGTSSDWVSLVQDENKLVTLKADGTLWRWDFPNDPTKWPETVRARQLGMHADWVALAQNFFYPLGISADGNLWKWNAPREIYPGQTTPLSLLAPSRKAQLVGNVFGQTP